MYYTIFRKLSFANICGIILYILITFVSQRSEAERTAAGGKASGSLLLENYGIFM